VKLPQFFIDRPIFATVLSSVIFIAGLISMFRLPISEYPEVVPPSVIVTTSYPGANPRVIAETVASPLEQAINGVENMLYMSSQSTADGAMTLTVTFEIGTDVDLAQMLVQNRVQQATPKLPEDVRRIGVTTVKSSPDLTMVVHLRSPDARYDAVYLRNYATLQIIDTLARLPGMGQVRVFGSGDYAMRVWLDPERVASRNLTAGDVVRAIREQNIQVAAGQIGAPPNPTPGAFQLLVNAQGRLADEEEFGNIVVKTGSDGEVIRLHELARIELDAADYGLRSLLDNEQAVAIPIFQAPGSNALALSDSVRATMKTLSANFPAGVEYDIVYDPTVFVRHSIESVVETLLEAILLVVIVVIVFLQTWRASIIPLLAVPVSIVGTFAILYLLGFSINTLTLFGFVLAIGIVVDDAIVVVENVERNIEEGLAPRAATYKAMEEVSGPIVAIALALCAVFVPIAFISGLNGQFYRQFALTIAISTVISALNSLTLSPALAALLLKPPGTRKDALQRGIDAAFGWFFRPFNRFFKGASNRYRGGVAGVLRHRGIALGIYVLLVGLTVVMFRQVPTGFVPAQDKQYLIAIAQLPDASTLDRTEEVIRRMSKIALDHPGVAHAVAFPGLSIASFSNSPNSGLIFFGLKPFEEREGDGMSGPEIASTLMQQLGAIQEASIAVFPPPPVRGLGTTGGFKLMLEDRADLGYEDLYAATQALLGRMFQTPGMAFAYTNYQINVPQLYADIDRVKAKQQGLVLGDVFETLQTYLGSTYVNDFNRFGRTFRVIAQADAPFRDQPSDIAQLRTRNQAGEMVPLGAVLRVQQSYGPDRVQHYNAYRAADINGITVPGVASGDIIPAVEQAAREVLPNGVAFEWTEISYLQILAGNTAVYVFPLCVLLVLLVLAAQYESWSLPVAVILIVPMCLLCAITGVWLTDGDNNIFTQVALFVLIGLACKNAILIVEFARELEQRGADPVRAALEACRLRLRPILMTSFAFIMGVTPLVFSSGAGAEIRQALGIAVFSGMLGVTFFGLFLTPVFYVAIRMRAYRRAQREGALQAPAPLEEEPSHA
jgi:hydrophobe/amphiphile efflux-1 (HAE1) family protein